MFGRQSWGRAQRDHSEIFGFSCPKFFSAGRFLTPEEEAAAAAELEKKKLEGGGGNSFTQDQVNTMMANEKRVLQQAHLKETEEALKAKDLTEKERKRLESAKTRLETDLMTEKETASKKLSDLEKAKNDEIANEKAETERWKNLYGKSTIRRTILDAAKAAGAHDEGQILDIFEGKVQLRDVLGEDTKPTGDYEVVYEVVEKGEDGKTKKRVIPVDKYIVEEHSVSEKAKNLYNSNRRGGSGGRPGSTGSNTSGDATKEQKISKGLRDLAANQSR